MSKTVTLRVEDDVYKMLKQAADGERRSLSNFIENATLRYLTSSQYVSDDEMQDIMSDKELVKSLENGFKELQAKEYTIV